MNLGYGIDKGARKGLFNTNYSIIDISLSCRIHDCERHCSRIDVADSIFNLSTRVNNIKFAHTDEYRNQT